MAGRFKVGDPVKLKKSLVGCGSGVVIRCQAACVYVVRWKNGGVCFYSGEQLERVFGTLSDDSTGSVSREKRRKYHAVDGP
jgi:hypothetical protein